MQYAMTWDHLPCKAHFDERTGSLALVDPAGRPYGTVVLSSPPEAAMDRLAQGLQVRIDSAWQSARGKLLDGGTAVLTLPDGTTGWVRGGQVKGWRRKFRTGSIEIAGRRFVVRHDSGRESSVIRDGHPVARLRRATWRIGNSDETGRVSVQLAAADGIDLAVVMVAATTLGQPGRPGFLVRLMDGAPFLP